MLQSDEQTARIESKVHTLRGREGLPESYPTTIVTRDRNTLRKCKSVKPFKFAVKRYDGKSYIACTFWKAGKVRYNTFYNPEINRKLRKGKCKVTRLLYSEEGELIGQVHNYQLVRQS